LAVAIFNYFLKADWRDLLSVGILPGNAHIPGQAHVLKHVRRSDRSRIGRQRDHDASRAGLKQCGACIAVFSQP
jgi:hypothetical protein